MDLISCLGSTDKNRNEDQKTFYINLVFRHYFQNPFKNSIFFNPTELTNTVRNSLYFRLCEKLDTLLVIITYAETVIVVKVNM